MLDFPLVVKLVLASVVMTAGVYDIRQRRIPNWLTVTGVLAGFALNGWLYGLGGLLGSAKGIGLAFLVYLPLYLLRAFGAGDVKLMGAVGAIVGPAAWLGVFLFSVVIGALFGIVALAAKGRVAQALRNMGLILKELSRFRAPYAKHESLAISSSEALTLPHGAAIALGSLVFIAVRAILSAG